MSEYEGGTFRCTVCAKEFLSKDEADRHFSDTHSEEKIDAISIPADKTFIARYSRFIKIGSAPVACFT